MGIYDEGLYGGSGSSSSSGAGLDPYYWSNRKPKPFLSVTAAQYATLRDRKTGHAAIARAAITAGPFAGRYFLSPGGPFGTFYPGEIGRIAGEGDITDLSAEDLASMAEWILSHKAAGTETYTGVDTGGTFTLPAGALPCILHADNTHGDDDWISSWGDIYPLNATLTTGLFWALGDRLGWGPEWRTWWGTNGADVKAWFAILRGSTYYDSSAKLWKAPAQACMTVSDGGTDVAVLDGIQTDASVDMVISSCMVYEMESRGSLTPDATYLSTLATEIDDASAAIRALFRTVRYPEVYESAIVDFRQHARGTGIPDGNTAGGTGALITLADSAVDDGCDLILATGEWTRRDFPNQSGNNKDFRHAYEVVQWEMMTDHADGCGFRLGSTAHADFGSVNIEISGGEIKYRTSRNGPATSLPTATSAAINTRYRIKCVLNWTSKQYEVFVNGVSKGTVAMDNTVQTPYDISVIWWYANTANATATFGCVLFGMLPAATVDTRDMGYLLCAEGPRGSWPSVYATSKAVWAGILTPSQAIQAGRWIARYKAQPDQTSAGAGNYFCSVTNARWFNRVLPRSHEYKHGEKTIRTYRTGPSEVYGWYIGGGYLPSYSGPILYALSLYDWGAAAGMLSDMVTDVASVGANAPHEQYRFDNAVLFGAKYFQSILSLSGVAKT